MPTRASNWRRVAFASGFAALVLGGFALVISWWLLTHRAAIADRALEAARDGVDDSARWATRAARAELRAGAKRQRRRVEGVGVARRHLQVAIEPWSGEPERALRDRFIAVIERGDVERGARILELWSPSPQDAAAVGARVDYWIATGQLDLARQAAWAGAEGFVEARPRFMRRLGLPDVEAAHAIARRESRLVFFEEGGESWLYGTLKDWVPGFVQFPIEEIDAWRHLVDGSMSARELRRTSVREALAPLAEAEPDWWTELAARLEGATAYELAHQLSDMHVLDALINNWDRYSSSAPGSNCQFNHGRFVSIDNGASFQTPAEWSGHGPALRLSRVRRFSRRTIDAVRWMQPEALFEVLFPPNPHVQGEQERWRWFLERRVEVLAHVDALIERSGEERVLIFP